MTLFKTALYLDLYLDLYIIVDLYIHILAPPTAHHTATTIVDRFLDTVFFT